MVCIYKITSPSDKVYIGQTISFKRRLNEYKNLRCKGQVRLYNSLLKYGFKRHKIEVVEQCEIKELNERERYYQEKYKTISDKGLNCKYVGTETKKYRHSEETKLKISKSNKGKKHPFRKLTETHKANIGLANKGNKRQDLSIFITKENKKRKGEKNNFYGRKHSLRTKKLISKKKTGVEIGFKSKRTVIILNEQTGIFYTLKDFSFISDRKITNSFKFNRLKKSKKIYFKIV